MQAAQVSWRPWVCGVSSRPIYDLQTLQDSHEGNQGPRISRAQEISLSDLQTHQNAEAESPIETCFRSHGDERPRSINFRPAITNLLLLQLANIFVCFCWIVKHLADASIFFTGNGKHVVSLARLHNESALREKYNIDHHLLDYGPSE